MVPERILSLVKRFLVRVREQGVPIETAYLFGSWTQNRANQWSDIDLAIVSPSFDGVTFLDRRKMDDAVIAVDTAIETHPFRPEDFNDSNPFVREILRTGIRIA